MEHRIICDNCGHSSSSHRSTCKACRQPLAGETVQIQSSGSSDKTMGIGLLVAGIIGFSTVHSRRPPSGFGEAFSRMASGNDWFFREPVYQILLSAFIVAAAVGESFSIAGP